MIRLVSQSSKESSKYGIKSWSCHKGLISINLVREAPFMVCFYSHQCKIPKLHKSQSFCQVATLPERWVVTVYSLQFLFTANLHTSWVSACWITITVKFLWQQHEMPQEQFYSRLWQERHDWLSVQPWKERLVCSIIGCDTAWKWLHSVNTQFRYAYQQVNWVVLPVSLVYGQWVFCTERLHL